MTKVILWDVDGVLIRNQSFESVLARDHGIVIPASFFDNEFAGCQVGAENLRDVLGRMIQDWGWRTGVDDFLHAWFTAEMAVDTALLELIHRCRKRGVRCYLATMQESCRADFLLNRLGLARHFDGAFVSCDIGHAKTSPSYFAAVLGRLSHIQPGEIVLVDDQEANVRSARMAGLSAISFVGNAELAYSLEGFLAGTGAPFSSSSTREES